ncbi:MAG TPA: ATPase, partial [Candidatus Cloacimonas sp.]|nr:ATPase [Candidatus Cloacimonas sp.]
PLGKLSRIKDGELDFLEARMEIGVEQASPLISQALDYVDNHFPGKEFQLLDSPPGTSCSMIAATKTADFAILVTEPTPFGLHDLSLAVETLRQLQIPIAVVINRSGANDGLIEEYCSRESIPIWSKIPHLRKIAGLYSEGQLLYQKVPELQQSLDEIIAKLEELS